MKNIEVVDEAGNIYQPTYPKRAKGLVKHGRARYVSDGRICLACPPKIDLEDEIMSNTNSHPLDGLTVQYLLEQILRISEQTEHLHDSLKALQDMSNGDSGECGAPGNLLGQAKAEAIGNIVASREVTNQQILRFYERMYEDLMTISYGDRLAVREIDDHQLIE